MLVQFGIVATGLIAQSPRLGSTAVSDRHEGITNGCKRARCRLLSHEGRRLTGPSSSNRTPCHRVAPSGIMLTRIILR